MQQHITAIIPCYNEENKIKEVIKDVSNYCSKILVIDDNSTDKSLKVISQLKNEMDIDLNIFKNEKNMGIGYTMKKGISEAIKLENEIIIKIDGDGQHLASDIPKFISKIKEEKLDFVKGNRFLLKKNLKSMPLSKLIGNLFVTNLQKLISGNYSISDPNNGFLAFKKDIFETFDFDELNNNYFFENSLLIHVTAHNFRVGEVGIETIYNDEKSSIPLFRASLKTIPTFIKLLFTKNLITARYNLSINSILFFIFWPVLFANIFYNYFLLWILLIIILILYLLVDLLNFFSNKKNT
tara:strand:+ start:1004 stop:1891 length:888 start_codon:yes stop_codon:yes gene_type:complete